LALFKTVAKNTLIGLGDLLLPSVASGLNFVNTVMEKLGKSPGLQTAFKDLGVVILAGMTGAKLASIGTAIAASFGVEATILAGPLGLAFATAAGLYLLNRYLMRDPNNVNTPEQNKYLKEHPVNPLAAPTSLGAKYGEWRGMTMMKYGLSTKQFNLLGQEFLKEGHSFKEWQMGKANIPQLQKTLNKVNVKLSH
jgi:hypothetical protein